MTDGHKIEGNNDMKAGKTHFITIRIIELTMQNHGSIHEYRKQKKTRWNRTGKDKRCGYLANVCGEETGGLF